METIDYLKTIQISELAIEYLHGLLKNQPENTSVRMFVVKPGTPDAETCLSYCKPGEEKEDDEEIDLKLFILKIEAKSAKFLAEATVNFDKSDMGGQLTIKAPNSRLPKLAPDSSVSDRVNYILWNDINPMLSSHGGQVTLIEINDDGAAIVEFGGGCQGCRQLDVTLKHGVEEKLLEQIPELTAVRDITDHSDSSKAYFQ